jgi:hypothetical protein
MPEVYSITVQIKAPARDFPGQVCHGCYTFADGVVTLTDCDGNPVRDGQGQQYTRKLPPGSTLVDAENAAGALTKEFRLALLGKTKSSERFSRRLTYPKVGY